MEPFLSFWWPRCLFTPWNNSTWASLSYSLCYQASLIVFTSVGRHTSFPSLSISWGNGENAASSPRCFPRCDSGAQCSLHRVSCFNKHAVLVARSAIGSQLASLGVTGSWTVVRWTEGSSFALLWHFIWSGSACVPACRGSRLCYEAGARSELAWPESVTMACRVPLLFFLVVYFLYIYFLMASQHGGIHIQRDVSFL